MKSGSPTRSRQDVTELLQAWSAGSGEALDKVMPVVYAEFRRLAQAILHRELRQTIEGSKLG